MKFHSITAQVMLAFVVSVVPSPILSINAADGRPLDVL